MLVIKKTLRGFELIHYKERLLNTGTTVYDLEERERDFQYESAQRSKREIIDYGLSNKWTHFITITFDPAKHNRYQYDLLVKQITKYFDRFKQRYDPTFKYLLSPEQHKDKALHFHGLVILNNTKHLQLKFIRDQAKVFNHILIEQKFGFNEFTEIYNHNEFVTYYVSKYVSKNYNSKITSQRYYASKGLNKPDKMYLQEHNHKHEFRDILSLVPSYQGQFATKWKLSQMDLYQIFRYQDNVKEFIKNE